MPQLLENKLKFEAKKRFPNDKERQDAYVYGTLTKKFGWQKDKPKQE